MMIKSCDLQKLFAKILRTKGIIQG